MLWQLMFNEYVETGGNLRHMDNMLIDLKSCHEICRDASHGDSKGVIFGWSFDKCGSTFLHHALPGDLPQAKLFHDCAYVVSVDAKGATIVPASEFEELTEDGIRRKINA